MYFYFRLKFCTFCFFIIVTYSGQVGFRSFLTRPIFSESNLNCDKHKFERFLQSDRFSVASCYGPITLSACPLLVFKNIANVWTLVATGLLANVDPDRIVLKKVFFSMINYF
jgi:pre-rRNA-processing protein TSR1